VLLALPAPTTPPSSITATTSPGGTPRPIGKSFFTKCVTVDLTLLGIPAALLALRWSRETVEEVVFHVNRLDINSSWGGSGRRNLGEFGIGFFEVEFAKLTFEGFNLACIRRNIELPVAWGTS